MGKMVSTLNTAYWMVEKHLPCVLTLPDSESGHNHGNSARLKMATNVTEICVYSHTHTHMRAFVYVHLCAAVYAFLWPSMTLDPCMSGSREGR